MKINKFVLKCVNMDTGKLIEKTWKNYPKFGKLYQVSLSMKGDQLFWAPLGKGTENVSFEICGFIDETQILRYHFRTLDQLRDLYKNYLGQAVA